MAQNNVSFEVKNGKLIVTMDVGSAAFAKAPSSSTGKTKLVASTGGGVTVPVQVAGFGDVKLALNLSAVPKG